MVADAEYVNDAGLSKTVNKLVIQYQRMIVEWAGEHANLSVLYIHEWTKENWIIDDQDPLLPKQYLRAIL